MPVRQKSIEYWVLNVGYTVIFPMPSQAKKYERWVLGIESFECWVLNIGYTVIFPMPGQAKKYECWVLGIGH